MRLSWVLVTLCSALVGASAQELAGEAWQLESKGEALQARDRLQKAMEAAPNDAGPLWAYAEFLDRHRDPSARDIYARLDQVLSRANANASERLRVNRRLAILDLIEGDRNAAERHLEAFRAAGGAGFALLCPDGRSLARPETR